jgi:hypothetical protein
LQDFTVVPFVVVEAVKKVGCNVVEWTDLNVYIDVEPAVMLYYSGASGLEG